MQDTTDLGKTIVLGFDALDFRYLNEFKDTLTNFSSLRANGIEAPLQSTFPPWTGSAWPSMYTGTNPSHHGVFNFFKYDHDYPDNATIVTRNDVKAPAIWNYLSVKDIPSIVLNVPITHPAEPINGVLIPGYLADEQTGGYPGGIRNELDDTLQETYSIYSPHELSDNKETLLKGCLDLINLRKRAALKLLQKFDWQFAFIQVQKTDTAFHKFSDKSAHRQIYQAADNLLGSILDATDWTNVFVCSDHGIGPVTGYKIYLNEILRQRGLLETSQTGSPLTLADKKLTLLDRERGGSNDQGTQLSGTVVSKAINVLDYIGFSPGDVYYTAQRLGMGTLLEQAVPEDILSSVGMNVDWRRSKAYCSSQSELGIRINLEGRESHGIVQQSDYEDVRDDIIGLLSNVITPDGNQAFDFVKRREEIYEGPCTALAPDVVFMPTEMNHIIATSLLGREFIPVDTFNHKRDGVFIGTGAAIDESADIPSLSLTDVAPLTMAVLGLEVPERMTGSPPSDILKSPFARCSYPDVPYGTAESGQIDTESVTKRLEDLGYL